MCFVDFGFTEVLTLVGKNVIVRGQLFHCWKLLLMGVIRLLRLSLRQDNFR